MKIRSFVIVLFVAGLLASSFAFAAQHDDAKLPPEDYRLPFTGIPTEGKEILNLINRVASWVFAIFVAISVIFIVVSAFEFVTAQGDPAKITKARQALIYSVIGIVLALIAVSIPIVIRNIVVGETQSQENGSLDVLFTPCSEPDEENQCQIMGGICRGGACVRAR